MVGGAGRRPRRHDLRRAARARGPLSLVGMDPRATPARPDRAAAAQSPRRPPGEGVVQVERAARDASAMACAVADVLSLELVWLVERAARDGRATCASGASRRAQRRHAGWPARVGRRAQRRAPGEPEHRLEIPPERSEGAGVEHGKRDNMTTAREPTVIR